MDRRPTRAGSSAGTTSNSLSCLSLFIKILILFAGLSTSLQVQATSKTHQTLILISLDGFRHDYLDKYKDSLPVLRQLASAGVRAKYVQNVYPTVTFPNHYTIVTGLYPESHGLVGNNMYDPVFNATFNMLNNESRWWNGAEPIWVSNEKQGHKSGMCFWPGYDVKIKGHLSSYRPMNTSLSKPFVGGENILPFRDRVDMVIKWLNQTDAPSLVTLYIEEPDEVGHSFGVDSPEMANTLKEVDSTVSYLMNQLRNLSNFDSINLIITGDHGMMNYNASTIVNIDKFVKPDTFVFWTGGASEFLVTNSSKESLDDLFNNFKKAEIETGKIKVYRKGQTPDYLHFKNNRRIADIIGVAVPGYLMNTSKFQNWTMWYNLTRGTHGYDPATPEMHPFLIAYGPAFKQGYSSGPVQMIDLYSLMCHILAIEPAPNNGSFSRIKHILEANQGITDSFYHFVEIIVLVVGSCIVVAFFLFGVCALVKKKVKGRMPTVHFHRSKAEYDHPLMESEGEEDDVVIM